MKILFTQFTPPFTQLHSSLVERRSNPEQKYLDYTDWYSQLRKLSAKENIVKFISFTKRKKRFSIVQDGYESVFFPITNPNKKPGNGRWDFIAPGLLAWVKDFAPDVIHIIGTGHLMASEIIATNYADRVTVWVRVAFQQYMTNWNELHRCGHLVFPTATAAKDAEEYFPKEKLTSFPLGANLTLFKPDRKHEKRFDVMSVARITHVKQIHIVKHIVNRNNLSWLNVGGIVKGWPFRKWEDLIFFNRIRRRLQLPRVKRALYHPHICGFFNNAAMPSLYSQSKVFVHPSLAEGAPRCVQEALACEVPVVALKSTVPYIEPEFGIPCSSHDEFEDAVLTLLSDNKKRARMGRNGREWLVENHSPEKLYETFQTLNYKISN